MEPENSMNTEDMELALAYWRTMAPQPKAIIYTNAIEARLKGVETKEMVIDHELSNAITRGASIARGRGMDLAAKGNQKAETSATEPTKATETAKTKAKRTSRAKTAE
jgi:hypothetical protein